MKKLYTLFLLVFFLLLLGFSSFAQSEEKESLKTTIELPTGLLKKDGKINLTINYGTPPYSIYLSEAPNIPSDISDFIAIEEGIDNNTCVFNNLKRGNYYIFVKDGDNITDFKQVNLDKSNKL